MGFIEKFFQSTYDRLQQRGSSPLTEAAACFDVFGDRMAYLTASLTSIPIKLASSDGSEQGTWGFRQNHLFLPEMVQVLLSPEENYDILKFRLIIELVSLEQSILGVAVPEFYAVDAANLRQGHLSLELQKKSLETFVGDTVVQIERVASAKSKNSAHAQDMLRFRAPGRADLAALVRELKTMNLLAPQSVPSQNAAGRLRKKKINETTELYLSDPDMNPLVHTFEKIHTLDDYTGGNKQIDESDELSTHARALEELNLNTVVRTNQTSNGTIEGEISRQVEIQSSAKAETLQNVFNYDEWNESKHKYLLNWCQIQEHHVTESFKGTEAGLDQGEDSGHSLLCKQKGKELRQRLAGFFNARRWNPRQLDGSELDLAAIIDNRVERLRGGQPSEKNYLDLIKIDVNFGLTILCDASLSTEAWVAGNQVQHIIQDAAMMLSYGLQGLRFNWSLAGFNSFTHDDCHYYILKDFAEDAAIVRRNIQALTPDGYTRMGPALRHAGFCLSRLKAKENMVIIITDAKPTDYDHYEGSYGVCDVKRAVAELKARNICTYAISVSDRPEDQAARMFGHAMAQCTSSERLSELIFGFFVKFISRH